MSMYEITVKFDARSKYYKKDIHENSDFVVKTIQRANRYLTYGNISLNYLYSLLDLPKTESGILDGWSSHRHGTIDAKVFIDNDDRSYIGIILYPEKYACIYK